MTADAAVNRVKATNSTQCQNDVGLRYEDNGSFYSLMRLLYSRGHK